MPELTDRSWAIRPARATDAPNMLSYMQNLAQESVATPDLLGLGSHRRFTGWNWRSTQKIAPLFASTKSLDSPSKDENNTLFISTDATMTR